MNHSRTFLLTLVLLLLNFSAQAQQYGWVRVATLGNPQFTFHTAVEFVDSLNGWTASDTIYKTTDGGNNWEAYYPDAGFLIRSISMADRLSGWAAGYSGSFGGIIRTTNSGLSWFQQRYLIYRGYRGIAAQGTGRSIASGKTAFTTGSDTGKVVQTTDGGLTWTEQTIADSIQSLNKVQFIDSLHGWITAEAFEREWVLRTTDGGSTWEIHTSPFFEDISFIDTLNGWGIGREFVYRTSDGGVTWTLLASVGIPNSELLSRALSFADSLYGWAFGLIFYQGDLAAAIFNTTDGGHNWSLELVGGGARHINAAKMIDRYHGWAVGDFGSVFAYRVVSSVPERVEGVPRSFNLRQNYPNPFNPNTTIEYEVIERGEVTIQLFDMQGREVRTLVRSRHESGVYRIHFDATGLASGVYSYSITAGEFSQSKQMTLLK